MMTTTQIDASESGWKRFWRRLAMIEEEMSRGYDGYQDRRLDYLEAEVKALKTKLATLQQARIQ